MKFKGTIDSAGYRYLYDTLLPLIVRMQKSFSVIRGLSLQKLI